MYIILFCILLFITIFALWRWQQTPPKDIIKVADSKYNRRGAFKDAERLYKKASKTTPLGHLKLGRMYRDGTNKLPSDGIKAVESYIKAFQLGGFEDAVLEVG